MEGYRGFMNDNASRLFDADRHSAALGARLLDDDGWAIELELSPQHLKFLGLGHGAALFALADLAFNLAANAEQQPAFAVDANISFVRAVQNGDTLRAKATPERITRSLSWYRVDVTNQEGDQIAVFNGTV